MYRSLRAIELEIEQDRDAARERWYAPDNPDQQIVMQSIANDPQGFLADLRQAGAVTTPQSDRDLQGFPFLAGIAGELTISTAADALDDLDLTYANLQNVVFDQAFLASNLLHGTVATVTFRHSTFFTARIAYTELMNVTFDHCDFVRSNFINCDLINTTFEACYWNESGFEDCRADANCRVDAPLNVMQRQETAELTLVAPDDAGLAGGALAGFYYRLGEAFRTGSSYRRARHFEYIANQSIRRSRTRRRDVTLDWLFEITTGYGLRPERLAALLACLVFVSGCYFAWRLSSSNGWMLGAGAVFTFGAFTDMLKNRPAIDVVIYVVASVAGVAVMALLVATVVSGSLRDRA
jgi:Pentapeptide repeats (9 copies)